MNPIIVIVENLSPTKRGQKHIKKGAILPPGKYYLYLNIWIIPVIIDKRMTPTIRYMGHEGNP